MRAVAFDQPFRAGTRIGRHLPGQSQHVGDVVRDLILVRALAGRAQDQAIGAAFHRLVGDLKKAVALVLVADRPRDIQARRVGGDDGKAALEQYLAGYRDRLARLGITADLHQQVRARRQPLDLAQKGRAVGCGQEHAALPLNRPVGTGTVDRTGRWRVTLDEKIVKLAVDHQRGGLAAVQVVQKDGAALHAAPRYSG